MESEARQSMPAIVSAEPGVRAVQMPDPHTLRFLKSGPTSAPPTPLNGGGRRTDVEESMALAEMGSDPDFAQRNSGSDPISAGSINSATPNRVTEAPWPKANVVIGNPPFLGGSKKRRELGDDYFKALGSVFAGRVPCGADLVCYWFDKARLAIESNGLGAAGLVATNSIRSGSNRKVLDTICQSSRIFDAWSDKEWVNEGVAVSVSLVCFGQVGGSVLDGREVAAITSDLEGRSVGQIHVDMTTVRVLEENTNASF